MSNPPEMTVQLIHIHGGLKGEIRDYHERLISIGRLGTCSVRFPADEPGVSRQHATIEREGNQFKLTDQSKYGTFVNGRKVKEAYLRSGDVIEFGPGGPKASINIEAAPSASPGAALLQHPSAYGGAATRSDVVKEPPPAEATPQAAPSDPLPPTAQHADDVPLAVAPLVIQFGPTIRSYCELPVTIGAGTAADFILPQPGILECHARIFFRSDSYWIRDLTGRGEVRVNLDRAEEGVPLHPNDEISLTLHGPVFRFLGDGRLAEVDVTKGAPPSPERPGEREENPAKSEQGSFLSSLARVFRRPRQSGRE